MKRFCAGCQTCQCTVHQRSPPSPLIALPIIKVPFERILKNLDYATRYPEAIPLWKKNIAKELFLLFTKDSIPTTILTDQGTTFMSWLMADLCHALRVKQLRISVYHPQTNGLVERFKHTLKRMLKQVVAQDGRDWNLMLSYVFFGIREVP